MKLALTCKLIIIGLGLFGAQSALAARCSSLAIKYNVPATFDVTGKSVGERIFTLNTATVSGTCLRDSTAGTNYLYIVNRGTGGSMCYMESVKYSSDGYLKLKASTQCPSNSWMVSSDYKKSGTGNSVMQPISSISDAGEVTLNNMPPAGKTVISNPLFFHTPGNYYSRYGGQLTGDQLENLNVSATSSQITLINNVSCAVSVNDVNFGTRTIAELKSGNIAQQFINLKFDCNDRLPYNGYSLAFQGQDGVQDANNGILKVKNNSTVGYKLTWGAPIFAATDSPVVINNQPIKNTAIFVNNSFHIPIKVQPIALTSTVKGGPINTSLIINVKLN